MVGDYVVIPQGSRISLCNWAWMNGFTSASWSFKNIASCWIITNTSGLGWSWLPLIDYNYAFVRVLLKWSVWLLGAPSNQVLIYYLQASLRESLFSSDNKDFQTHVLVCYYLLCYYNSSYYLKSPDPFVVGTSESGCRFLVFSLNTGIQQGTMGTASGIRDRKERGSKQHAFMIVYLFDFIKLVWIG